ncbi:hypothetical protein [Robiginitalea sp. SC105]|uniref:hypothetical protein n=1 Tax=Robiginitalea sp. SC105 TaxID=2762332 RepID=UPI00163A7D73|nr:hypothetical protein [Robiginitalea sp. SC105]MBC2838627.1 hypothetical protein [Robiginitalea sp. SC105]
MKPVIRLLQPATLLLISSLMLSGIARSQTDQVAVEAVLQQKITEAHAQVYQGRTVAYADLFAEDAVFPKEGLVGADPIRNMIARWQIPPTEYAIEFYPLAQIDSSYVMSYKITETSGFVMELVEVWKAYSGEFKIAMASVVVLEPGGSAQGISMQRFILSSVVLGIALFLLFIIFRKAARWKRK